MSNDKQNTNDPQEVRIVNEKPSVGERIKEYGLFALIWHGMGYILSAAIDMIFGD